MTSENLLMEFGGIDADLVLAAAPSERFSNKKRYEKGVYKKGVENYIEHLSQGKQRRKRKAFIRLGVLAAAIVLLICAVPLMLNLLQSSPPEPESYQEVLQQSDTVVFGTYKSKTEKLTYTEYTFEVTEVLKGEVNASEITVRSEKKTIFSDDEMEKHAQELNTQFKEGVEYFLALELSDDEILEFVAEQIVEAANIADVGEYYDELKAFLAENGVELNSTREELKAFWEYIFGGLDLGEAGENVGQI